MLLFIFGFLFAWSIFGILFFLGDAKDLGIMWWENEPLPLILLGPIMWLIIGTCYIIGAVKAAICKIKHRKARD